MADNKEQIEIEILKERIIGNKYSNLTSYIVAQSHGLDTKVYAIKLWPVLIELNLQGLLSISITIEVGSIYWRFGIGIKERWLRNKN